MIGVSKGGATCLRCVTGPPDRPADVGEETGTPRPFQRGAGDSITGRRRTEGGGESLLVPPAPAVPGGLRRIELTQPGLSQTRIERREPGVQDLLPDSDGRREVAFDLRRRRMLGGGRRRVDLTDDAIDRVRVVVHALKPDRFRT